MPQIVQSEQEYLAIQGFEFGAEVRNPALANDGTLFLQIEATTRTVILNFGAGVEALTWVDSFIGSTLTTPTTVTPFNYKPSSTRTATAVVRTSAAVTTLGTARGTNQSGSSGLGNSGVGGSSQTRKTVLAPGQKVTLRLTNKGGAAKCVSVGVYFDEV